MPKIFAAINTTRKISKGCALTLFEKISGCKTKLSNNCTNKKTEDIFNIYIPRWILSGDAKALVKPINIPNAAPIKGPIYGIRLNKPANIPKTKAFSTPKTDKPVLTTMVTMVT
jgi:hypothetical protein